MNGSPAGIAQVEEIGRAIVWTLPVVANANEHRRHPPIKPRPRFEHADHPANRPGRSRLAPIRKVAVDQPVAKTRRLEPIHFQSIADRNLGMESSIRRAIHPRTRGEPQEDIHCFLGLDGIAGDSVAWEFDHCASSSRFGVEAGRKRETITAVRALALARSRCGLCTPE